MEVVRALRAHKKFEPKSLVVVPAIACSSPRLDQERGIIKQKEITPDTLSFYCMVKWKVVGAFKPALRDQKVLHLTIERDHQGLKELFGFKIGDPRPGSETGSLTFQIRNHEWRFCPLRKMKIFIPHHGCVTKWYQIQVTTLGLLWLTDESLKNVIWSTFEGVTPYLASFLKFWLKMLLKKRVKLSTVCMHLRN
jgi:hypothetical protein